MSTELTLFAICMTVLFIAMLLFVIFGQVTVRKLRKNPEIKGELGVEFASGWDILNVAGALALPRWINRKLRETPLSYLYADADLLDKYTNRFDKALAVVFYFAFVFSGTALISLAVLDAFDAFD